MGTHMKRLLSVLLRYPEGWRTIGRDALPAMRRLEALGFVEIVWYDRASPQARLALPEHKRAEWAEWSLYHERATQMGYRDVGDALRALADYRRN